MASEDGKLVLYHNRYSICSIMVRYAFACRGEPQDPSKRIGLDEKEINISTREQLAENFLCDVNVNGEVPVLILPSGIPLPESVAITLYFGEFYPSLLPPEHKAEIEQYLKQLHDINFFALTFAGKSGPPLQAKQFLNDRLKEDITPRYRKAIERKIKRIDEKKLSVLTDEQRNIHFERTKTMMRELEDMLNQSNTDWCFGLQQPTALDAHLIVFVARLLDINRGDLIPERVKQYVAKGKSEEAWNGIMQGRNTIP